MSNYINRYELYFLTMNLARYWRQKSQIEQEVKGDVQLYGKINESEPSQNFVYLAEKQIIKELNEGVNVRERYGEKFLQKFSLPKIEEKEEIKTHD